MSNQHPNEGPGHESSRPISRLDELLADRATQGLDDAEHIELRRLLTVAGKAEDDSLDLTAAACDRALYPTDTPLPANLLAMLDREAEAWSAGVHAHDEDAQRLRLGKLTEAGQGRLLRTPFKRFTREWGGWIAAAACLAFGVYTLTNRSTPAPGTLAGGSAEAGIVPAVIAKPLEDMALSLHQRAAQRIDRWFNNGSGMKVVPLGAATPDSSADVAVGQVFWNAQEGNGVLKISRIDPSKVGASRTFRVSVFDATGGDPVAIETAAVTVQPGQSEVVVPLDTTATIRQASAFVVSVCSSGPLGSTQTEGPLGISSLHTFPERR